MIVGANGQRRLGSEFGIPQTWFVQYDGFSGELVFLEDNPFDSIGYDLPSSHLLSAWHEEKCAYCGKEINETNGSSLDHIVPYSRGGSHLLREFSAVDNRAESCDDCNRRKWHHLGWSTLDGRTGFFWDGTPGHAETVPPLPIRARRR